MFEEFFYKLESKKGFEGHSVTKYLGLTLVFMWNSALKVIVFTSINKMYFSAEGIGTRLSFIKFRRFSHIS